MARVYHLPWDSDFFGVPVGRLEFGSESIDHASFQEEIDQARLSGISCLYLELPFDDAAALCCCTRPGFHLVDLRTRLVKNLTSGIHESPAVCDIVSAKSTHCGPELEAIIDRLAKQSRYSFDPRFGFSASRRLFREWLRRTWEETFAEAFFVAMEKQAPVGLLTIRLRDNGYAVDLLGTAEHSDHRGIATSLLGKAVDFALTRGERQIRVTTQGHNIPAMRFYQKQGFFIEQQTLYYHLWLD